MASVNPYKNPSGVVVWRVQFRVNGRGKQATFATAAEARRFGKFVDDAGGAAAIEALDNGAATPVPSFEDWTLTFLDPQSGHLTGVDARTRDDYRRIAEQSLFPVLQHYPINMIDKTIVGKWVAWQENQSPYRYPNRLVSAKTVKNHHGVLSTILRAAMEAGLRPDNPAYRARLTKGMRVVEPVFLSVDEYNRVYDAIKPRWQPLVAFLVGSQLRWSEAAALDWTDINRDTFPPTVRVTKAWKRRPDGPEVMGPPKSPKSRRTVSLWPALVEQLGAPGRGFVFQNPDGGRVPTRTFANAWALAKRDSGISRNPRVHDLRHTGASWLIADGVPLPFIQARLGHESITTTVGVYGHLLPDAHTRMAESLSGIMTRKELEG